MTTQLQKPDWVFFNGKIRRWEEAVLHVGTEAVNRGLSVFEGIRGYAQAGTGRLGLLAVEQHYARLCRSARLLHIPCTWSYKEFVRNMSLLVKRLQVPGQDMWVRATLFVVEGHWGENTVSDLVLTGYQQGNALPKPLHLGVSTWRRSSDVTLPPRIKAASNYQVSRLARIEGRSRGCGEMILMNDAGRVAEATGSCVFMVRDGIVSTPPATEGALESITVGIVRCLCQSMGIPFCYRPIDRTELYVAEEVALAGTLSEITLVNAVDGFKLSGQGTVFKRIMERFRNAARGVDPHPAMEMTLIRS